MVRNNNWTEEKISLYCDFLEHMIKRRLEMCNNSKEELAYHLLIGESGEGHLEISHGSDPITLFDSYSEPSTEGLGCSAQDLIHFNTTNLLICFCHRLAYPQFVPIYLITNEEKTKIIQYPFDVESGLNQVIYMSRKINEKESIIHIINECNRLYDSGIDSSYKYILKHF